MLCSLSANWLFAARVRIIRSFWPRFGPIAWRWPRIQGSLCISAFIQEFLRIWHPYGAFMGPSLIVWAHRGGCYLCDKRGVQFMYPSSIHLIRLNVWSSSRFCSHIISAVGVSLIWLIMVHLTWKIKLPACIFVRTKVRPASSAAPASSEISQSFSSHINKLRHSDTWLNESINDLHEKQKRSTALFSSQCECSCTFQSVEMKASSHLSREPKMYFFSPFWQKKEKINTLWVLEYLQVGSWKCTGSYDLLQLKLALGILEYLTL